MNTPLPFEQWVDAYANRWLELAADRPDIDGVIDDFAEAYRTRSHEDPVAAAQADFKLHIEALAAGTP